MQKAGVEKILPIGQIDEQEKSLLAAAVKELGPSIEKVRSAHSHCPILKIDELTNIRVPRSSLLPLSSKL